MLDPLDRRSRQHAVHRAGEHAQRPRRLQRRRRLLDRAGGIDDVVLQDTGPAVDIADDVHHFRRAVLGSPLVDDRQFRIEPLRIGPRAFGAAGIRRDDRQLRAVQPRQVIDDDRRREQMIHRDVEKPLDLRLVQIHRQHPVRARGAEQVRHELGRNRHPRLVLAVLPRVAVIRYHRRNPRRRRAAKRVDHHQQLHQVRIHRSGGRLDNEDVGPADVLVDLERHLAVGKSPQPRLPDRDAQEVRDLLRQRRVRAARKHFQVAKPGRHQSFTAQGSSHLGDQVALGSWVAASLGSWVKHVSSPPATEQPSPPSYPPMAGWGGRIRTSEYGSQSPAPYRLATPHHGTPPRSASPLLSKNRSEAVGLGWRKRVV